MQSLSDAIPRDHFRNLFEVVEETVTADDRDSFYEADAVGASTVNLFMWDEAVHRGLVKNGEEMKKFHPHDPKRAYRLTKSRINREPIKEVFCAEFFNEHSDQDFFGQRARFPFAQIDLVRCYPDDIHISDVTLLDLTKPVQDRGAIAPRSHRGLHVFHLLLDGLVEVAKANNVKRISLVAASRSAHDVFSRYGFQPTETDVSQFAFHNFGHSHAMALNIT